MDYYQLYNLEKEPFSNTPDPAFFYRSTMHAKCLMDLEIALRLRRGLCIVEGAVGTGKTTLCRHLIHFLSDNAEMAVHLLLDPGFDDAGQFAKAVSEMLCGRDRADSCSSIADHREMIRHHLFEAGVDQNKTIVLIIDEAQKLTGGCVEFLRELLNYETNDYKLLQIVLFAQDEITDLLDAHANFADRVALYLRLGPLDKHDTAKLIQYRLQKAKGSSKGDAAPVFTAAGIARIHRLTGGYPRKIIHLSHHILMLLLIKGKSRVGPSIASQAAERVPSLKPKPVFFRKWCYAAGFSIAGVLAAIFLVGFVQSSFLSRPDLYWPDLSRPNPPAERVAVRDAAVVAPVEAREQAGAGRLDSAGKRNGGEIAEETPERPDDFTAGAIDPPAHLGAIRIRPNESLWIITRGVYGKSGGDILDAVLQANPDMGNANLIRPGQEVLFPVVAARPLSPDAHYWIVVEKARELDAAYRFLAAERRPDMRLVSFWDPADDQCLHVVAIKDAFANLEKAENALAEMPPETQSAADVLDLSGQNMYRVNGHW